MYKKPIQSAGSLTLMYVASFLLCVLFGVLLVQIGIPGNYINLIMLALLVGGYIFSGMFGKTMVLPIFQTAERSGSAFYVGQSVAAGLLSSSVFILLAGDFYNSGTDALAIFSGLILGISLMTLLFAAPLNRSQATTLANLGADQKTSKLMKALVLCIVFITSFLLLYVQLAAIGKISELYFQVPANISVLLASLSIGFCLILGGMQSLNIIRMISYPILAIAFLTPIIWISYKLTGNPFPQLSYGAGALQAISEIDQEMLAAGFAQKEDLFQITRDGLSYDSFNYFAALICIAFGTAAMPHILQHFKTLPKARNARKTGVWALGFVLLILTAIPAVAIFVKFDIYSNLLGLQLADLDQEASWIFSLSDKNSISLISICGEFVASSAQAIAACGQTSDYFLSIKDIGLNADLLLLTSATLNELPIWVTTMLATGCLFAIWTTADGLVLVIANSLAEDGYHGLVRAKSPMGSRLFMTRLFILLLLGLSTYFVLNINLDTRFAFAASFALLASSLFPFLFCKFWMKNLSQRALGIGIFTGFIICASLLILSQYGVDFIAQNGDEMVFEIPYLTREVKPLSTGLIGLIMTIVVIAIMAKIEQASKKSSKVNKDVLA